MEKLTKKTQSKPAYDPRAPRPESRGAGFKIPLTFLQDYQFGQSKDERWFATARKAVRLLKQHQGKRSSAELARLLELTYQQFRALFKELQDAAGTGMTLNAYVRAGRPCQPGKKVLARPQK